MSFRIEDIKKHKVVEGGKYLFDANIWLAILDTNFSKSYMPPYEALFEDIITHKTVKSAKVVMPSLLLSEILNRYMNDIFYKEFCKLNPVSTGMTKHEHYKHVYRTSPVYSQDLAMACSGIRTFSANNGLSFLSDNLDNFTFKQLTKNIPVFLDINDHLYAQIAKAQGLIIVTNDGDFRVEDVTVVTGNPALLKLKT
jgi:predicted nucleic acid-binding protein